MSLNYDELIVMYQKDKHLFEQFKNVIVDCFRLEPTLNQTTNPTIHSIKSRLKDPDHLRKKLERKNSSITSENFFSQITDLAGVRVLHLYQDQFPLIHTFIQQKVNSQDWFLAEKPIAYSWDPEAKEFFEKLELEVKVKESYYTSIHYLIKPKESSQICCEIQVRTLFEEIWGEIDHTINYPVPTSTLSDYSRALFCLTEDCFALDLL